jgi:membrane protease YdiL (CAAX protease family)
VSHRAGPAEAAGSWLAAWAERAPVAAAAAMFGALAAVRIGGAYDQRLMVASIALTPAVLLAVPRRDWARVGLCRPGPARALATGVAATVAAYAAALLACGLAFGPGERNWTSGVRPVFEAFAPGHPAIALAVAVVCMGLLVPVAEEVCYRGVLHDALARRAGAAVAVAGTAAAWAVVHLGDYGLHPVRAAVIAGVLPSVFVMGLALGYCRVATRSVLGSVVAQAVANLLLVGWVFTR